MTSRRPTANRPELAYTGERHMTGLTGIDLSLGEIDHMVRYAAVAPFAVGKRVLDIACGSGYGSQFLALQGAGSVVGVDVDQAAIEYAQAYHAHPGITYLRCDAHAVPDLEGASFDLVVAFETIEHVERPREFLAELRRLLKPGGACFISCPNDHRASPWLSEYHLNRFKFSEFRDLILAVFGKANFLGQHNACTSSLLKPRAVSEHCRPFGAYVEPLPPGFFGNQYAASIAPIENAAGYFAVIGVEGAAFPNHASVSDSAFEQMLSSMHFYTEEARKAAQEAAATREEVAAVRGELDGAHRRRAEQEAASAREVAALRRAQAEAEEARVGEVSALRGELELAQRRVAEAQSICTGEVTAIRGELEFAQRRLSELGAERAHEVMTLHRALETTKGQLAELEVARAQEAALRAELDAERRRLTEVDTARSREVASLTEQLLDKQQRFDAERKVAQLELGTLRDRVSDLHGSLHNLRGTIQGMESSKFWKLRSAWVRVKGRLIRRD